MTIVRKLFNRLSEGCWSIGFIEGALSGIIAGKTLKVHYLQHQFRDRWFADPWLLEVNDDTIKILVEEYTYKERRGYISLLIVDRHSYRLVEKKEVLILNSHLSFPAIMRDNDKVYMYPENAEGEGLGLYEINSNGDCHYVRNLSKEPLADAVITDHFGERLLFSTHIPTHNDNVLSVHHIDTNTGKTEFMSDCSFNNNIARNAGDWFCLNGHFYRPAQDCNGGYGMAVILQEVVRNTDGSFSFQDIRRITSTHPRMNNGLHTFNHLNGLSVIDVHGYRYAKWIAKTSITIFDFLLTIAGR